MRQYQDSMQLRLIFSLIFLEVLIISPEAIAAEAGYRLIKNTEGIKLYVNEINNRKLPTILAHFTLNVDKARILCLLRDPTLTTQWVPNSLGATILEKRSPTDTIVLFQTNMPFPFKNRDAIIYFKQTELNANTTHIEMNSTPSLFPEDKNFIRIPDSQGSWHIESIDPETTKLTYHNYVVLGGRIPSWLVISGLKNVTFDTALNFIHLATNPETLCPNDH